MSAAPAFTRHTCIGTGPSGRLFVTIKFDAKGRLSITGVEGPKANGDAEGSFGQIVMHEWPIHTYAEGWDSARVDTLRAHWERWHLNDMVTGSPAQEAHLRAHPVPRCADHYTRTCEVLQEAGLNPDPGYLHNGKPYAYGHAWLREEVPAAVVEWLRALPDSSADLPKVWK